MAVQETLAQRFIANAFPVIPQVLPILSCPVDTRTIIDRVQASWLRIVQGSTRRTDVFEPGPSFSDVYQVCLAELHAAWRADDAQTCAHQWWPCVRVLVAYAVFFAENMGPAAGFFNTLAVALDDDDTGIFATNSDDDRATVPPTDINQAKVVFGWLGRVVVQLQQCTDADLITVLSGEQQQQSSPLPAQLICGAMETLVNEGLTHVALLEDALSRNAVADGSGLKTEPGARRLECDDVATIMLANLMSAATVFLGTEPVPPVTAGTHATCTEQDDCAAAEICTRLLQTIVSALVQLQIFAVANVTVQRSGLAVATEKHVLDGEPATMVHFGRGDCLGLVVQTGSDTQDVALVTGTWAQQLGKAVTTCLRDTTATDNHATEVFREERAALLAAIRKYVLAYCETLGPRTTTTVAAASASPQEYWVTAVFLYVLEMMDRELGAPTSYIGLGPSAHTFLATASPSVAKPDTLLTTASLSIVLVAQACMVAQAIEQAPLLLLNTMAQALARTAEHHVPLMQRASAEAIPVTVRLSEAAQQRALELLGQVEYERCRASVRTVLRTVGAHQYHTNNRGNLRNVGSFAGFLQVVGRAKQAVRLQKDRMADTQTALLFAAVMPLGALMQDDPAVMQRVDDLMAILTETLRPLSGQPWQHIVTAAELAITATYAQPGESLDRSWVALLPTFADGTNRRIRDLYCVIVHIVLRIAQGLQQQRDTLSGKRPTKRQQQSAAQLLADTALAETMRRSLAILAIPDDRSSAVAPLFSNGSLRFSGFRVADIVPEVSYARTAGLTGFPVPIDDKDLPVGCVTPLLYNSNPEATVAVSNVYALLTTVLSDCPVGVTNEEEVPFFAAWATAAIMDLLCITTIAQASLTSGRLEVGDNVHILRAMQLIHGSERLSPERIAELDEALAISIGYRVWCQIICKPVVGVIATAHATRGLQDAIANASVAEGR